jgi:dolichol-phosphate mannosyltransferase
MRTLVVIPTYQEAANITALLAAIREAAPDADVLVVDDNSPDGTATLAEAAAAESGSVKVLRRPGKAGLGSAYRHGFRVALDEDYEAIVSMDADFSHDPAVIPRLVAALDDADAAIGSRYVPGGGTPNWPLHRRLLSKWGNRYTGALLGLDVSDATSGFRAYRAAALAAIEPDTTQAEGYAFLTELVRRLTLQGKILAEVPITFVDRRYGVSKMSGRIIVESMIRVTRWGVRDRLRRTPRSLPVGERDQQR